jgi:IclR family pca regulon transcriptional regulator
MSDRGIPNKSGRTPNESERMRNKSGRTPNASERMRNKSGRTPNASERMRNKSGRTPNESGRYSQSLGNGLAVLAGFRPGKTTRGIADMADELRMSRSTTHRYATTLAQLGYLEQGPSRRYRLSPRAADFGHSVFAAMALHERSRALLRDLRHESGWTISLGILDGGEVMLVERLRGWRGLHEIDLRLGPSSKLPLHCTAMGKVLLAGLPPAALRERLKTLSLEHAGSLGEYGPNCISAQRVLRARVQEAQAARFALDDEELSDGLRSVAVAVCDARGATLAALDLSAPGALFTAQELSTEFRPVLVRAAERLAADLA